MKKPLSFILLSSLFIVSACDEPEDVSQDPTAFRAGYKGIKAKKTSTTFSMNGTDDPTGDGSGDPIPGWPLHELEIRAVLRNADAIYASAFAGSDESRELCPSVCREAGEEWSGRVSASGAYDLGEVHWMENEEGLSYQTEVHAEVDMSCLCTARE